MESQSANLIVSGIEPIDELMGGLERGQLYLVHGEATGKSLFGIKFLIEGLKQSENVALVIRYSPEDAVRRFARLGYDCLDDVYSGRLVILEYSDDIIQKLGKLRQLTPVLRELEWLLGETSPERLIFDPVASVLAGSEGSFDARAREFADWARSFGGTVVLIDNGANQEIIESFKPLVAESFRLDVGEAVREAGDRASRFIAFENSPAIPDQAIEIDPSRGIFLLGRAYEPLTVDARAPQPPSLAELESIREELRSVRDQIHKGETEPLSDIDLIGEASGETDRRLRAPDTGRLEGESRNRDSLQTQKLTLAEEEVRTLQARAESELKLSTPLDDWDLTVEEPPSAPQAPADQSLVEVRLDELSDLLDDLSGSAFPLDLDLPELEPHARKAAEPEIDQPSTAAEIIEELAIASREARSSARRDLSEGASGTRVNEPAKPSPPRHGRASDLKIDSAIAARAVELLLRPPELEADMSRPATPPQRRRVDRERPQPGPIDNVGGDVEVHAKDFNVLIISDDSEITALVTQALRDYTLEVVHDGVSGLTKLISLKPDLVVLDFDLPIIDGSKVLTLIRSALNVPIVIVSGLRMRALDRVMASELGADYYLTKPFSTKELKHKARQLIARYRGIDSWIMTASATERPQSSPHASAPTLVDEQEIFTPYEEFAAEVEKRVKAAMETGVPFSIVGCRVPHMTANGGRVALRLFDIVRALARENDLMSTNPRNDLVVLLTDADTSGAQSFAGRLRDRVVEDLIDEPSLWIRSFPELEESTEAGTATSNPANGGEPARRSSDAAMQM
jgi:CheY-like chemotaxis protein/KaiC/GvpD/RAD55 family RecA-like ATPase